MGTALVEALSPPPHSTGKPLPHWLEEPPTLKALVCNEITGCSRLLVSVLIKGQTEMRQLKGWLPAIMERFNEY